MSLYGLRTWDEQSRLQLDTSTFTYQMVHNVVVNFAVTPTITLPINGNSSNHCVVILNLTGIPTSNYMPHIVVGAGAVAVYRYHPNAPNNGGTIITARILVMRFA